MFSCLVVFMWLTKESIVLSFFPTGTTLDRFGIRYLNNQTCLRHGESDMWI